MSGIKIFNSNEFGNIRVMVINNEPFFVGRDVAKILGYSNPNDAISKHVYEEDKGVAKCDTLGGTQELTVINESGLYSMIFSSKLPNAKKFKHWVTSEVLPSIRKHGMYAVDELINNPDLLIKVATELKKSREENERLSKDIENLTDKIEKDKPKTIFADAVSTSKTSILVGDMAKLIAQNGVQVGQKRLFDWLRENGYLIKSGSSKNMPIQRFVEQGLFEVKESSIQNPDGSVRITKTTKITGKGQIYFVNKFLKMYSKKYDKEEKQ